MDRFDGKCMGKKVPVYYEDTKVALVNNRVTTMSTKIIIQRDVAHDFKVGSDCSREQNPLTLISAETDSETLSVAGEPGFLRNIPDHHRQPLVRPVKSGRKETLVAIPEADASHIKMSAEKGYIDVKEVAFVSFPGLTFQGVYVVENGTFDGSAFSAFPVSGWYWKVIARTYEEVTNDQLLCVKVEGQIVPLGND